MKNYLAIIRRSDFIDLYKYGFFNLDKEKIVDFDCDISELPYRSDIFDSLFFRMNSFESSFAYLIINYVKEESSDFSIVSIEEVRHVFPLDFEAKREFESSFDEHIKIDNPIWSDAVSLIKKKQMFHSSMQGVRNIFNFFKLDGIDKCKKIISDDTVEEMLSAVYDDVRPQGDLPIWVYLMRYERHSFYPKDSLGYFMDIVHIVVNFMAKQEVDDMTVESTGIYNVLCKFEGKGLKSNEIMHYLKADKGAAGFLNKISLFVPEADFITTAISYLKLRDKYKDEFVYDVKFIEACKNAFGDSFTLASYMAGIAFSHEKTYSCLYKVLPLAIYKSKEEMAAILLRKQEEQIRAKREMECIEYERKKERELEIERRKGGKKKCKKAQDYPPFGVSGYSQGRGGYPTWGQQSEESFPPYQGNDPDYVPASMEKQKKKEFPIPINPVKEEKTIVEPKSAKESIRQENLFAYSDMQGTEIQTRKLSSFPLKLQKYTPKGKPSTAKNSIVEVHNVEEYNKFLNAHSKENWKPIKK